MKSIHDDLASAAGQYIESTTESKDFVAAIRAALQKCLSEKVGLCVPKIIRTNIRAIGVFADTAHGIQSSSFVSGTTKPLHELKPQTLTQPQIAQIVATTLIELSKLVTMMHRSDVVSLDHRELQQGLVSGLVMTAPLLQSFDKKVLSATDGISPAETEAFLTMAQKAAIQILADPRRTSSENSFAGIARDLSGINIASLFSDATENNNAPATIEPKPLFKATVHPAITAAKMRRLPVKA